MLIGDGMTNYNEVMVDRLLPSLNRSGCRQYGRIKHKTPKKMNCKKFLHKETINFLIICRIK